MLAKMQLDGELSEESDERGMLIMDHELIDDFSPAPQTKPQKPFIKNLRMLHRKQ